MREFHLISGVHTPNQTNMRRPVFLMFSPQRYKSDPQVFSHGVDGVKQANALREAKPGHNQSIADPDHRPTRQCHSAGSLNIYCEAGGRQPCTQEEPSERDKADMEGEVLSSSIGMVSLLGSLQIVRTVGDARTTSSGEQATFRQSSESFSLCKQKGKHRSPDQRLMRWAVVINVHLHSIPCTHRENTDRN